MLPEAVSLAIGEEEVAVDVAVVALVELPTALEMTVVDVVMLLVLSVLLELLELLELVLLALIEKSSLCAKIPVLLGSSLTRLIW